MPGITEIDFLASGDSLSHSRITTLEVLATDSGHALYSATRHDGLLQHWVLTPTGLDLGDQVGFDGGLTAGGTGTIVAFATEDGNQLLSGGGSGGHLQTVQVLADGGLAMPEALDGLPDVFRTFQHTATYADGDTLYIYGGLAAQAGVGRLAFDVDGNLSGHAILADPTVETMAQITASTVVSSGGQTFFVTASVAQNGLAVREITGSGDLGMPAIFGSDEGLWIDAPSAMEGVEIGGRAFVILGAAGSDSLSVVEVGTTEGAILRDHVMDTRETRFGGVTAIEIVEKDGKVYVIAGGADDGVSVFVLLEGGTLVHRAAFEDTDEISLNNVSAIASHPTLVAHGLDFFVASSSEAGVTHLRHETGTPGISAAAPSAGGVLTGTAGFDILYGQEGDDILSGAAGGDILQDGAGADVLAGGAGRDVFVMSADGEMDTITDFTVGEDRIDLSLWPLLRDISQLTISLRSDGMEIRYGDEVLVVQSSDNAPIDYRLLESGDLIGASRLSSSIEPGFAGPPTPVPDLSGQGQATPPEAAYMPMLAHDLIAKGVLADLSDALGRPKQGPVVESGHAGQLTLGTTGGDLIVAMDGNDTVNAGLGDDLVFGGNGDDRLLGGEGADHLLGGNGDDVLEGGAGDDVMTGGGGTDKFVFFAGNDTITDFTLGVDEIQLDARLWTGLTSVNDLLFVYASTDAQGTSITFDTGDVLQLPDIFDLDGLAQDIALF